MNLRIRGKTWRLVRKKIKGVYGLCDDPDANDKCITIDPDLAGENELATFVHEMLHAAFWDLKEEAVDEASIDLARALWRLGYRKVTHVG